MKGVGRADAHGIDAGIGKQLLRRGIDPAAEEAGHLAGAVWIEIVNAGDLGVGIELIFMRMALPGDRAAADDTCTDHNSVPSF